MKGSEKVQRETSCRGFTDYQGTIPEIISEVVRGEHDPRDHYPSNVEGLSR